MKRINNDTTKAIVLSIITIALLSTLIIYEYFK